MKNKKDVQNKYHQSADYDDDSSLYTETLRDEVWRQAAILVEECLHSTRTDIENCDLDPVADTGARMALEHFSRIWFERRVKG